MLAKFDNFWEIAGKSIPEYQIFDWNDNSQNKLDSNY